VNVFKKEFLVPLEKSLRKEQIRTTTKEREFDF